MGGVKNGIGGVTVPACLALQFHFIVITHHKEIILKQYVLIIYAKTGGFLEGFR
jgi:hypothetical protein